MTNKTTERGFRIIEFLDRNNKSCSLQKSSIAFEECIWLGCNEIELKRIAPGSGWTDVDTRSEGPGGVNYTANTRMHLTQKQVTDLLPYLQHFAEHGELPANLPANGSAVKPMLPLVPINVETPQDLLACGLAERLAREYKLDTQALPDAINILAGIQRAIDTNDPRSAIECWDQRQNDLEAFIARNKKGLMSFDDFVATKKVFRPQVALRRGYEVGDETKDVLGYGLEGQEVWIEDRGEGYIGPSDDVCINRYYFCGADEASSDNLAEIEKLAYFFACQAGQLDSSTALPRRPAKQGKVDWAGRPIPEGTCANCGHPEHGNDRCLDRAPNPQFRCSCQGGAV